MPAERSGKLKSDGLDGFHLTWAIPVEPPPQSIAFTPATFNDPPAGAEASFEPILSPYPGSDARRPTHSKKRGEDHIPPPPNAFISFRSSCIEEFLRKALLGEELVNTQFHLFSARSSPSSRVLKPRVLCANNVLLAKRSKYFLDLLSSDINPSDPSLVDLTDDNDVPSDARIDDYGYGSDSDLDDCNDPIPVADVEVPKDRSARSSTSRSKKGAKPRSMDDDESSKDGSESGGSDMFVMSPEQPGTDDLFTVNKDGAGSVASSETAVQETDNKTLANQTAMRLRSLRSRHVLVKDTAFQTWYTLLNYLYTDKFSFLPLGSTTPGGQPHESSTSSLDEPRCSAKSMYRLACKVGLDDLRDEAFSYIQSNLTEHNILKELSCILLSRHPQLLEMELDVLYSHIGSPPVVAEFPAFAKRIANKELPHGADIIVGIHARLLKTRQLLPPKPAAPSKSSESVPSVQPQASVGTACFSLVPKGGGKATETAVPLATSFGALPSFAPPPPPSISTKPKDDRKTGPVSPSSVFGKVSRK